MRATSKGERVAAWCTLLALVVAAACGEGRRSEEAASGDRDLELAIGRDTPQVALQDRPAPAPTPQPQAQPTPPAPRPQPRPQPRPEPPRPPEPKTATVAAGTTFDVVMDRELSTKTNKVGDRFTAKVAADVTGPDGTVLVPAGAVLEGEVTQVQASGGAGQEAVIGVAFRTLTVGNRSYPVHASVTAAQVESKRTTSDGEQAAKIIGGAAAGALLGKLIGKDAKSTIIGAAAGAAAGTAIALGTADYAGVIPAGGKLTVRLDEPIEVVLD